MSRRQWILVCFGLALVIGATFAWPWRFSSRGQVPRAAIPIVGSRPPTGGVPGPPLHTPLMAARRSAKAPSLAPLPAIELPLDQQISALKPMAEAGRIDAMLALGNALMRCRLADPGGDEAIRGRAIDSLLQFEKSNAGGRAFANETATVAANVAARIATRDQCTGIDPTTSAGWLEWIDKAAAAGDTRAMRTYASSAQVDADVREPLPVDPPELERRRERGMAYLLSALERGDCAALMDIEQRYAGEAGPNAGVTPDAAAAYAYLVARRLWEGQNKPDPDPDLETEWAAYMQRRAAGLDPEQISAAEAQGMVIFQSYCAGRPEE